SAAGPSLPPGPRRGPRGGGVPQGGSGPFGAQAEPWPGPSGGSRHRPRALAASPHPGPGRSVASPSLSAARAALKAEHLHATLLGVEADLLAGRTLHDHLIPLDPDLRALGPEPRENLPGGLGEPARKVALKLLEELSRALGGGRFASIVVVVPAARVPGAPRRFRRGDRGGRLGERYLHGPAHSGEDGQL